MVADSTAYLAQILTDPDAHGIDLERTAVLYMATGSEWTETRLLVEEFMLPLLREHGPCLSPHRTGSSPLFTGAVPPEDSTDTVRHHDVTIQAALGITTLLYQAPIGLALVHQAVAMIVLALATVHARNLRAYSAEQSLGAPLKA